MRIESRFGFLLSICFALGILIAGFISYRLEFQQAREETIEKSSVLLEVGSSVRKYTSEEIAPLLQNLGSDVEFHPQMVPSYGAQSTLERLRKQFPDYIYREASLNPTNLDDRATDREVGLIRAFEKNPNLKEMSGETDDDGALRYFLARPLRMTSPDCLQCHSKPEVAPKAMVAKYSAGHGFDWKLGDVIGVQIVEVPVQAAKSKALHSFLVTIGALASVFILTLTIFLLLLRRYVTHPLEAITRATHSTSLGQAEAADNVRSRIGGQFHELEESIHRLKVSLDEALRMFGAAKAPDRKDR
jgi:protein-histidine pros-kinase